MTTHQRYPSSLTLSLAEFLQMAGIPIIPAEMIAHHKRESLRKNRAGVWAWPLAVAHVWLYDMCDRFYARTMMTIAAVVTAALIGLNLFLSVETSAGWWVGGAVFAIIFPQVFVILTGLSKESFGRFLQAGFYWYSFEHVHCGRYREKVPVRIEHRVNLVNLYTSPRKTQIFVERFGPDPLIYAVDRKRPKERVYFGAWETGTDLDRL